jgi:hypothetical protein
MLTNKRIRSHPLQNIDWSNVQIPTETAWTNLEGQLPKNFGSPSPQPNKQIGETKDKKYKLFKRGWANRDPKEVYPTNGATDTITYSIECPFGSLSFKLKPLPPSENDQLESRMYCIGDVGLKDLDQNTFHLTNCNSDEKSKLLKKIVETILKLQYGESFNIKFWEIKKGEVTKKLAGGVLRLTKVISFVFIVLLSSNLLVTIYDRCHLYYTEGRWSNYAYIAITNPDGTISQEKTPAMIDNWEKQSWWNMAPFLIIHLICSIVVWELLYRKR